MPKRKADLVSCHSFRHMFITSIAKKKGSDRARLRAGHKSMTTTERYIHVTLDDVLKEEFNNKKTKRDTTNLVDQTLINA